MNMNRSRAKNVKAKNMYDSLTIRQAHHKNHALDAHLRVVNKLLAQEKSRLQEDIGKARRRIDQSLDTVQKIFPLSGDELFSLHDRRKNNINDVAVHVVNCYMERQQKNRRAWNKHIELNKLPTQRLMNNQDHLAFIQTAFPELCNFSMRNGYSYKPKPHANIYEHGRAAHDMKCMSTRSRPVGADTGAYPPQKPVNVRFWRPSKDSGSSGSPEQGTDMRHAKGHSTRTSGVGSLPQIVQKNS